MINSRIKVPITCFTTKKIFTINYILNMQVCLTQVKYTAGYNCSEISFWCDQMAVKGRRNGNSCVGSYLQV